MIIYGFWSSDKLTGSQTFLGIENANTEFWSSDKLTGSQTAEKYTTTVSAFWSSDKLTGSQTDRRGSPLDLRFGAVTN